MSERKAITQDHIAAACDMMAEGKSLRAACKELGLSESSVRYHLTKDGDAFAHSARARELGCDALADECLEIADNEKLKPDEKRVRIDTRIRLIGKWSQRYSDKLTVNNNTTVTHRYDLDSLSDGELAQLEALLTAASGSEGGDVPALPAPLHSTH